MRAPIFTGKKLVIMITPHIMNADQKREKPIRERKVDPEMVVIGNRLDASQLYDSAQHLEQVKESLNLELRQKTKEREAERGHQKL